ncbi:MAG: NADH-quinone oxidoreductase subunit M [Acidimicrobiales bacterium]
MSTALLAQESATNFPILPCLIAVPAAGGVVVAFLGKRRPDLIKLVALLFSLTTGAMSVWMLAEFKTNTPDFQFVSEHSWIKDLGISWFLGVDGISLFLVVLTGILFPLAIFGVDPDHDEKPYYAWLLLLEAGCMGVFMALDLFLFFVFFEIVLVPMYFLIAKWGHGRRQYAATKFFIYTMFGSALMLVGLVSTAVLHARAVEGSLTFNLVTIADTQVLSLTTGRWIFLAFAVAFAIKVPLFPVHTWLPDAHTEAPTAGSVILAGIMLKMGTYGFLRFGIYLFPEAAVYFAPTMITLGVIGIVYGAIVATMQRDLKRLVAYSSVAHLGFIVLGTFALNRQGIEGGILQMVNHGVSTGALFFLVGMIYERRHTREISELKGLQKSAPIMAAVFTVVMFSSIGLPGLNGFVGEFLTLLGAFASHRWWAVVATIGVILAALYLLWAYQRVFHGTPDEANRSMPDLKAREALVLAPLLGLIVFLGVYPKPVLDRMEPSVVALIDHVSRNVPDFSETGPKTDEQREEEKAEREAHAAEGGADNDGSAGGGEHK